MAIWKPRHHGDAAKRNGCDMDHQTGQAPNATSGTKSRLAVEVPVPERGAARCR